MTRTYVVTGAASGIGKATAELLSERGGHVIGVDLRGSDVDADLSTASGRRAMVEHVAERSGGVVDAVLAIAGLSGNTPQVARINYFGAIGTLESLRPLLTQSHSPRAVTISSMASLFDVDEPLMRAFLDLDEDAAFERAKEIATEDPFDALIYSSSKRALAFWLRRASVSDEWAGAGIPLNAIAPGVIRTPMTASFFAEGGQRALDTVPMPLAGPADPIVAAQLLAWLASVENSHVTGQIVFLDGGSDAVIRGDSTW